MAQQKWIWLGSMRMHVWSLASLGGLGIRHCLCGIDCKHSSDRTLLGLRHMPVATALIRPPAWEPAHALGTALKRQKKKKKFGLLCTLNRSFTWVWFCSIMHWSLENIALQSYADILNVNPFHYIISKKSYSLIARWSL